MIDTFMFYQASSHRKFAILLALGASLTASGCSTGFFKPVKPWHNGRSQWSTDANHGSVDSARNETGVAPPTQYVVNESVRNTTGQPHPHQSQAAGNQSANPTGNSNNTPTLRAYPAIAPANESIQDVGLTANNLNDPATADPQNVDANGNRIADAATTHVPIATPKRIYDERGVLVQTTNNVPPTETATPEFTSPSFAPPSNSNQNQNRSIQALNAQPMTPTAPIPTQAIPTQAIPTQAIPTQAIPTQAQPSGSGPAPVYFGQPQSDSARTTVYRGQSFDDTIRIPSQVENEGQVRQTAAQFPAGQGLQGDIIPNGAVGPLDSSNEIFPRFDPNGPAGGATFPQNYADLDIYLSETSTGRINFGGAFNSDSGVVGQFVVDERNFDLFRLPRNFRDVVDGTAWRGAGQNFRLELVPGSEVERYLVSFSEPFLGGSRVSFSSSFYLFQRRYFDFDEERLGGRFALGYRLTPDLSISTGLRLENVEIDNPRVNTSPQLNSVLGDTDLYVGNVSLIRDTRDHPFLPTEGNFTSATFSQAFGEFDFSRADLDFRTYRLMYERPDHSGRHTLSYGTRLGFSGSQTPVFENYYAGGFSTLRGFDFRGASPLEGDVRIGGRFQWLNSLEYMFPLTADDMVKGVLFTDFGTVEQDIEINAENFRVAPGFGFRVHLPAAGIGAPLAFDFAFPVSDAEGDEQQVFSFYIGVGR